MIAAVVTVAIWCCVGVLGFVAIQRNYKVAMKRIDADHDRAMAKIDADHAAAMAKIDEDFKATCAANDAKYGHRMKVWARVGRDPAFAAKVFAAVERDGNDAVDEIALPDTWKS